jgi:transposase
MNGPGISSQEELRSVYRQGEDACVAFMEALVLKVEELAIDMATMRRKLDQNSSNSSRPPSQDPPSKGQRRKEPTGRKSGGQKGHGGTSRELRPVEEADEIRHIFPEQCSGCGSGIWDESQVIGQVGRHQQVEIEIIARLIEFQTHSLRCRVCGGVSRGELDEVQAQVFGPRLQSEIATLTVDGHMTRSKLKRHLGESWGLRLSSGAITAITRRVGEACEPICDGLQEALAGEPAIFADETSWRLAGKRCYAWGIFTKDKALVSLGRRRSMEVAQDLIPCSYNGICHTDRYGSYNFLPAPNRQLCWEHLKRDFQSFAERDGPERAFGEAGLALAKEVFIADREGVSHPRLGSKLQDRGRQLIALGLHHDDTQALATSLQKHFGSLWHFLDHPEVEATNNHAERMLRGIVIRRKLSFGSGSESGAKALSCLTSVASTCRLQGKAPVMFFQDALEAHLQGQPAPALV